MVSYQSYSDTVSKIRGIIVNGMLQKIAFRHFEDDRGYPVRKTLPDKSELYDFDSHGFEGVIDPDNRSFENVTYDGILLSQTNMEVEVDSLSSCTDDLYDLWWDTFGENRHMSSQPNHPGDPPINKDDLNNIFESLVENFEIICADPTLEDLVNAIKSKNHTIAAMFLDADPDSVFVPGGGHELSPLFTNGKIHVVYKDREIALLKPEYNHELKERVWSEQLPVFQEVQFTGEVPEEAFVVGIDDTPTGLFAHSVDGTRLDVGQDVDRSQINNIMGFDRSYSHDIDVLEMDVGEQVRLQGDLAVEYEGIRTDASSSNRCNLPIDNHLCFINNATLPSDEDKSQEPITVEVTEITTLNVLHDEHESVTVQLVPGTYTFYLLPRGLQRFEERPDW